MPALPESDKAKSQKILEKREKHCSLLEMVEALLQQQLWQMTQDLTYLKKTKVKKTFKIHSLTDNTSVITAISNDTGYENVFINQLRIHYKPGDCLLVLSASGNSQNLIKAVEWVKKKSGKTICILGFDGGKLKKKCHICIHLKTEHGDYGPVEDLQLIINHVLAHWFQEKLKV